jgi:hypothetical protein
MKTTAGPARAISARAAKLAIREKSIYHALTELFLGKDDLPEEPELPKP